MWMAGARPLPGQTGAAPWPLGSETENRNCAMGIFPPLACGSIRSGPAAGVPDRRTAGKDRTGCQLYPGRLDRTLPPAGRLTTEETVANCKFAIVRKLRFGKAPFGTLFSVRPPPGGDRMRCEAAETEFRKSALPNRSLGTRTPGRVRSQTGGGKRGNCNLQFAILLAPRNALVPLGRGVLYPPGRDTRFAVLDGAGPVSYREFSGLD